MLRRWVVVVLVVCSVATSALKDPKSDANTLSETAPVHKEIKEPQSVVEGQHLTQTSSSTSTGESSEGIALDKHDFDVTNNKGGDVRVEVNLAAPMSGEGGDDGYDGEDFAELLKAVQPEESFNPIELMGMMKDMMQAVQPPQESSVVNVTSIMEEFKQSISEQVIAPPQPDFSLILKELTEAIKDSRPTINYPAPPPPPNAETIINALQPPPQIPQQPFDVGSFMRELRDTMAANKPPPTPPPGVDPQLLEMMRQTMSDMRDMHKDLLKVATAPPPPPPPTNPSIPQTPTTTEPAPYIVQAGSHPPPPAAPAMPALSAQEQEEKMRDMINGILSQIKPPTLPNMAPPGQDEEMAKLRDLLRQQALTAQKPIVLPPPVVAPHSDVHKTAVAPPPPPPQAMGGSFQDQMKDMIAKMIPAPQRIPAPPKIDVHSTVGHSQCCPAPTPEDSRTETERCPAINGVHRPRCKRATPPTLETVKCNKPGGCGPPQTPHDYDVNNDFNPIKFLKILCPGGLCPGIKSLDPALNPRLAPESSQAASL